MPLYNDPEMIKLVERLSARGRSKDQIAEELFISKSTVRKILVPGFAEAERARHAKFEKLRAPIRRQDPKYREYKAEIDATDRHRERAKQASRRRRHADHPEAAPATWAEAAVTVARRERVTAEDRRKAEAGRVRGTVTLSLDASIAANVLMRKRGCSWSELLEQLLLDATKKGAF